VWFARTVDGFRGWFSLRTSSGAIRTGGLPGHFTVTIVNRTDTSSTTATVNESVQKPGIYSFAVPTVFLTTHGVGDYGIVVEVNVPPANPVRDVFSSVLTVSLEDFDSLATAVAAVPAATNTLVLASVPPATNTLVLASVPPATETLVLASVPPATETLVLASVPSATETLILASLPPATTASLLAAVIDGTVTVQTVLERINAMARGRVTLAGAASRPSQVATYYKENGTTVSYATDNKGDVRDEVP
jgi:hypothetical protein